MARVPFEDADALAEVGQADAGRQPRHAGADDDRVVHEGSGIRGQGSEVRGQRIGRDSTGTLISDP